MLSKEERKIYEVSIIKDIMKDYSFGSLQVGGVLVRSSLVLYNVIQRSQTLGPTQELTRLSLK